MKLAITRDVSPNLARCELTHLARRPIDPERGREQHHGYERCLTSLGCAVLRLPPEADLPDSVFVEDVAVVLDEIAILTRPGAASRRGEVASVAEALRPYRTLAGIQSPATLDGGDVLVLGKTIFVGLSSRTDALGIDEIRRISSPFGYAVRPVPLSGCLHLKSAVTRISEGAVLIHPGWADPGAFSSYDRVEIDPSEPFAANALLAWGTVIYPATFPRTLRRLEARGIEVVTVDVSELAKAEGAVTCCSLLLEAS
jgi:dimethylargininase